MRDVTQESLHAMVAKVPQDMVLFNDTIYHNIAYGNLQAGREEVWGGGEGREERGCG